MGPARVVPYQGDDRNLAVGRVMLGVVKTRTQGLVPLEGIKLRNRVARTPVTPNEPHLPNRTQMRRREGRGGREGRVGREGLALWTAQFGPEGKA